MPVPIDEIGEYFQVIPLVPDGQPRPFWSVMLPCRNRTTWLEQTLRSVLDQDPGPDQMQIKVMDNASDNDAIEQLVKKLGAGRIEYCRQPRNIGILNNWNSCIIHARGHWVHILHDDDLVDTGFYAKLRQGIEANPGCGLAWCRFRFIFADNKEFKQSDPERAMPGILENWLETLSTQNRMAPPATVVARAVYEKIGGYETIARFASDWELCMRVAAYYPCWYTPEILASYRVHDQAATREEIRRGNNLADQRTIAEFAHYHYLPEDKRDMLMRHAFRQIAESGLFWAEHRIRRHDVPSGRVQLRETLRTCRDPSVLWRALKLMLLSYRESYRDRHNPPKKS